VGKRAIYVAADSTGETGTKVVQATLLQFRHEHVRLRIFSSVRGPCRNWGTGGGG